VAAIASVGETIAPMVKATAQEIPSIASCAITATALAVASTRPTASREMARRS